jgi:hypothetical protein
MDAALGPYAWKNFEWGGDKYIRHPDTGFEFTGFIVPHFEAVKEMAKAQHFFLTGWWLGYCITGEGPILIRDHVLVLGSADGGRRIQKNKIFKAFEELNSTSTDD